MDDKKRAAYRAEVERKGKALKALRGERGISSQKPPCAYDKIQLRDWLASLRIEDEAERAAYLAAMLDHWFTGVFPEHLDGKARAYFEANEDRFEDARTDSFRKARMLGDVGLEAWAERPTASVSAGNDGASHPVSHPVSQVEAYGEYTQHSYKLLATSHEPLATGHGPISPLASKPQTTSYERGPGVFEAGRTIFHAPCPVCGKTVVAWFDESGNPFTTDACGRHSIRLPPGYEARKGEDGYTLERSNALTDGGNPAGGAEHGEG